MDKKESMDDWLNRLINESEEDLSSIINVGGQLVDLADPPPLSPEQIMLSDLWQKMLRGEITLIIPPTEGGGEITEEYKEMLVAAYGVEFDEDGAMILRNPDSVSEPNSKDELLPCKPGTKWEDISIWLVDNDMVRVGTPDGERLYTFHQLDMADGRKPNKPRQTLWPLLMLFAKNNGVISVKTRHMTATWLTTPAS